MKVGTRPTGRSWRRCCKLRSKLLFSSSWSSVRAIRECEQPSSFEYPPTVRLRIILLRCQTKTTTTTKKRIRFHLVRNRTRPVWIRSHSHRILDVLSNTRIILYPSQRVHNSVDTCVHRFKLLTQAPGGYVWHTARVHTHANAKRIQSIRTITPVRRLRARTHTHYCCRFDHARRALHVSSSLHRKRVVSVARAHRIRFRVSLARTLSALLRALTSSFGTRCTYIL